MFNKRNLEAAALSIGLTLNACGEANNPDIAEIYSSGPNTNNQAGAESGGSAGQNTTETGGKGGSGGNGGSGFGGQAGLGGLAGQAGSAGNKPCDLISSLTTSPQTFDPSNTNNQIQYILSEKATIDAVIKKDNTLTKTLLNKNLSNAGTNQLFWDGKNNSNNLVVDGLYQAQITASTESCSETATIGIEVKKAVAECLAFISASTTNISKTVPAGTLEENLGCFTIQSSNCNIGLQSINFTNQGTDNAKDGLSNVRLSDNTGTLLSAQISNFNNNDQVQFNSLAVKVMMGENRVICLKADISNSAAGHNFQTSLIKAEHILAVGSGNKTVKINGNFPLKGSAILVSTAQ